jgi:hypothetical protein
MVDYYKSDQVIFRSQTRRVIMMNEQMEDLLAQAAALRAAGSSWKAVAAAVGRDVNTVKHWPERFPNDWLRLRLIAQHHLLGDAYGEALTSLRVLMRSQNEKSVHAASATVVRAQLEHDKLEARQSRAAAATPSGAKPAQLSTEGQKIAGILDGMSMEQMLEMAKKVAPVLLGIDPGRALKAAEGEALPAGPGGEGPNEKDGAAEEK